jgi:AraC-like DNA-binding protein
MPNSKIVHIKTITDYHRMRNLQSPAHPLISLVDYRQIVHSPDFNSISWVYDFYLISMKKNLDGKIRYGQQHYDFDDGTMFFFAPGQVFRIEVNQDAPDREGWMLLVHPEFFWNTSLAKTISKYEYFGYSVREALFLSESEEAIVSDIVNGIAREYQANIDKFSKQIIVSQIEVLLNYADRFYHRQFITRDAANHQALDKLEMVLNEYFASPAVTKGLPTVHFLAGQLNLTPDYLSSLLKVTTGLSAQQHIHEKLIAKAKEKLSVTDLSVSEIAYALGFEHVQSFSKLFKAKTNYTPLGFRQSFN